MKLDWSLVRCILSHVECETIQEFVEDTESLSKWKENQLLSERVDNSQNKAQRVVFQHLKLLTKAEYIEGIEVKESLDGYFSVAFAPNPVLTLSGYSLLESLRTEKFIDKLKKYAQAKSVPLTVDNVIELAKLGLSELIKME